MSYIPRAQTISKARELYNDLLLNFSNLESYDDHEYYMNDLILFQTLSSYLLREGEILRETEMDGNEDLS